MNSTIVEAGCRTAAENKNFNINVLILGKTGVGKSSLVNYLYGRDIAVAKTGRPVTARGFHRHEPFMYKSLLVTVYDSWGLEADKVSEWYKDLEEECKKANSGTIADWFHTVIYCFDAKKSRLDSFEKEHILDELMKNGVRLIFAMTKWGLCSEKEKNAAQETLKKYYPDLSAVPIESVSQKLRNQTTTVQLGRDDLFYEMCINLRENLIFNLLNITRQKVNSAVNKSKRDVEEYYDEQAGFFTAYGSDLQNKIISYAADSYERNVSAAYQTLSDTYEQINLMSRSVISSYTGLNLDPEGLFIRKLVSEEAYKITGWDNSFSEYFYTLLSFTNIPLLIIRRLWIKRSYGEKISEKLDEANGSIQGSLDKYFERILYTEKQFRESFLMKYRTKRNRT